jgi:hypothetical protein
MRHRIFVPLATDIESLREVEALAAGDGQFRLVGSAPPGEVMRFRRGDIVECEIRALPGGSKGLVAIRSVSDDPEVKKRKRSFALFGAIVGGLIGAAVALWIEATTSSAAVGLLIGAAAFGLSSVRWGDDAWVVLSRVLRWL